MINIDNISSEYIELCKLIKENGFKWGSDNSFVEYQEDYIYDNDPTHPESHKAGEIRVYNRHYFKNDDETPNRYEIPDYDQINRWLYNKGIFVSININNKGWFMGKISFRTNIDSDTGRYEWVTDDGSNWYDSYDKAYINGFIEAILSLKELTEICQKLQSMKTNS